MAYSREEAAELIIKAGYALVEKGLIARTWGNISARLSDTDFWSRLAAWAMTACHRTNLWSARSVSVRMRGD